MHRFQIKQMQRFSSHFTVLWHSDLHSLKKKEKKQDVQQENDQYQRKFKIQLISLKGQSDSSNLLRPNSPDARRSSSLSLNSTTNQTRPKQNAEIFDRKSPPPREIKALSKANNSIASQSQPLLRSNESQFRKEPQITHMYTHKCVHI